MAAAKDAPKTRAERNAEMVRIKVRRPDRIKSKGIYCAVNGNRYFIPYNQVVEVPRYIALCLENSEAQDERTADMIVNLAGGNF